MFSSFCISITHFNLTLTVSESQTGQLSVAGTAVGAVPRQIDLKVTQLPGGQLSQVSGFVVGPEDVLQVKQGENLIVSTSPELRTHKVTVRNVQGTSTDLAQLPSKVWSLQGLLPGIYTLNVNVAMSSSGILGTYETILVVLGPNQKPVPPTTIISQITIEETEECPTNSTLVNGTCQSPPPRQPGPRENDTEPIICPLYIYYGKDPCAFDYIPPNENGECPEDHEFVNEDTGCVPEWFLNPPAIATSPTPRPPPTTSPTPEPPPVDQEEGEGGAEQQEEEVADGGEGGDNGDGDDNGSDGGDNGGDAGNGGNGDGGGGSLFG